MKVILVSNKFHAEKPVRLPKYSFLYLENDEIKSSKWFLDENLCYEEGLKYSSNFLKQDAFLGVVKFIDD